MVQDLVLVNARERIIRTLMSCNGSLILLDLKQKSGLANLYFFKALEQLLKRGMVEKTLINRRTLIRLVR